MLGIFPKSRFLAKFFFQHGDSGYPHEQPTDAQGAEEGDDRGAFVCQDDPDAPQKDDLAEVIGVSG